MFEKMETCSQCHDVMTRERFAVCSHCQLESSRSTRSCKRYTFCRAEYGSTCDCDEEKEREEFEKWWPSVGQTIGKAAAWEAWRARGKLK